MEIRIEECTKDTETCPIVELLNERILFEDAVADLDDGAKARAQIYRDFTRACLNSTCPGMDPRLAHQINADNRAKREEQ